MSKIRCLLIDDEPPAIELLEKYTSMVEQLEVVGTSHSAVEAFNILKDNQIDLIFLDIQMPVLNGIDFVKTLKNPPAVIFTTAYREYALEGFELDVIDYLLKPIAFNRFLKAVDRYRQRFKVEMTQPTPQLKLEEQPRYIFFNVNRTHHKVMLDDILYIESLKDYVRIHTQTDRLVVKGNIGSIMKQLPDNQFVRIHRSYAIAIKYVTSYNQSEVEIAKQKLPIGMSYKDKIGDLF